MFDDILSFWFQNDDGRRNGHGSDHERRVRKAIGNSIVLQRRDDIFDRRHRIFGKSNNGKTIEVTDPPTSAVLARNKSVFVRLILESKQNFIENILVIKKMHLNSFTGVQTP